MTFIDSIATAVPEYRHSQEALCSFLEANLAMDEKAAQLLRRMASQAAIDARYSVLPDFSIPDRDWIALQKSGTGFTAGGMAGRMDLYFQHALELSLKAIAGLTFRAGEITHLLAVSCTGMAAPGLDLMICDVLNLRPETQRSCIHFMGCYAAIHALKQADYICRAQPDARVLVVCTELCTLHIRADQRPDNLASTLLFGDGAAAVLLGGANTIREKKPMFRLRNFASVFLPSGKCEMAWHPDEEGFRMDLGRFVPDLIAEGIPRLLQRARGNEESPAGWAIHPGGRKIMDKVADVLAMEKTALNSSYEILKEYGNMSSPTVLFVLEREFRRMAQEGKAGQVFAAAFGPGLTLESMMLETC